MALPPPQIGAGLTQALGVAMVVRHSKNLSDRDAALRIQELTAENKRLNEHLAKVEVAMISLKHENQALKKDIERKAYEKYLETVAQIVNRAEGDTAPGPAKSRRNKGHT